MAKISALDTCQTLLAVWLAAFNEEAIELLGGEAKLYLAKAYKAAVRNWMNALKEKYGLEIDKDVKTPKEAVASYIKLGVDGGLFSNVDDFFLEDLAGKCAVKVTVNKCPYREGCEILKKEKSFSQAQIPCPRIGCFSGAVEILLNIRCGYRVETENSKCVGIIFSLEEECREKILEFL